MPPGAPDENIHSAPAQCAAHWQGSAFSPEHGCPVSQSVPPASHRASRSQGCYLLCLGTRLAALLCTCPRYSPPERSLRTSSHATQAPCWDGPSQGAAAGGLNDGPEPESTPCQQSWEMDPWELVRNTSCVLMAVPVAFLH